MTDKRAQTDRHRLRPQDIISMLLRNRKCLSLAQLGFANLKTRQLSVYIPTLKNGGLLRNILLCQHGHLDGQKALIYAACRGQEQGK